MSETRVNETLEADEPVGLLAVPAEHAEQHRAWRLANPATVSELLRRELSPTWGREPIAARRNAVNNWLASHTPGALLALDIQAQERPGGILAA